MKVNQKGFTLIEILVALAIAGVILGVTSAAVITIIKTSSQNDEWNVNLRQVQNAGHWITRDALMAQVVSDNTPGVFLNLSWCDWDNNTYNVQYDLDGTTLTRSLTRSLSGESPVLISQSLIAQYIVPDPAYTNCDWNDNDQKLTVTIRASLHSNDRYVEKTYEISPRPANRGG
jgi:prepilin-type N-terminal cleavage/methylation domain-containing protein